MGACGSTGENTERKKLKEDDLPEENRSKKYADNKAESQPSNVPVTEPGPVATKNQMLAPVKEKEKEKQTEKKAIQDEGNKLDDNKRIFMDTPLKLPPELPGLNRVGRRYVLRDLFTHVKTSLRRSQYGSWGTNQRPRLPKTITPSSNGWGTLDSLERRGDA
eukprot:1319628-Amorphochlora_amoeboformis.AAC.2